MMLYDDELVEARLAERAAANGHVVVSPKREVTRLAHLSEEEGARLFLVASYIAAILFQGLKAEGTNIIINEDGSRLAAHVIARSAGDGLDFRWQPGDPDEAAMGEAYERLKDRAFYVGRKGAEAPQEPTDDAQPDRNTPLEEAEERESYLIKQLIRVP